MSENATKNTSDGPSLSDCKTLIGRINGTIAALERERLMLERRVAVLTHAQPDQRRAG